MKTSTFKTTVLFMIMFSNLPDFGFADDITYITPEVYYDGNANHAEKIKIPVYRYTTSTVKLFHQKVSYRQNKKARINFTLPRTMTDTTNNIEMILEAYNDDSTYQRSIWFEVDGIGGYIGTAKEKNDLYQVNILLSPKKSSIWKIDLSSVHIRNGKTGKFINFTELLKKPGLHTVSSWVSTYEQFGPQSWVSVELVFTDKPELQQAER